jgi:FkbM family methyltransferase
MTEHCSSPRQRDKASVEPPPAHEPQSRRWSKLRNRVVELGIRAIWGEETFPASMSADVPLISAGLRFAWLKALAAIGVRSFVATSGLGCKFVCHVGDLAEYPFYHRRAFRNELAICAAWIGQDARPIVFDVGANVGFFCTHLAQMAHTEALRIYAFEPVDMTFVKLVQSVERLGLEHRIRTVAAAVLDAAAPVRLQYPQDNSLYAQITTDGVRAGNILTHAAGVTLDGFSASSGSLPTLLKIDVEGYEIAVLRGAQAMLSRPDRPALAFEYYPDTLRQCGSEPSAFHELLAGYELYYVDDFEGQKMPLGRRIDRLEEIDWGCNLFAVPRTETCSRRWPAAFHSAQHAIRALG